MAWTGPLSGRALPPLVQTQPRSFLGDYVGKCRRVDEIRQRVFEHCRVQFPSLRSRCARRRVAHGREQQQPQPQRHQYTRGKWARSNGERAKPPSLESLPGRRQCRLPCPSALVRQSCLRIMRKFPDDATAEAPQGPIGRTAAMFRRIRARRPVPNGHLPSAETNTIGTVWTAGAEISNGAVGCSAASPDAKVSLSMALKVRNSWRQLTPKEPGLGALQAGAQTVSMAWTGRVAQRESTTLVTS